MLKHEFSPALRSTVLYNMLVNLKGLPGHSHEGDLMQEHHNKFLEGFIQQKDSEYGAPFIRDVVAPNVHQFQQIQATKAAGVGIQGSSSKHGSLKSELEMGRLAEIYASEELHCYREGRTFGRLVEDQLDRGFEIMDAGRLRQLADSILANGGTEDNELEERDGSIEEAIPELQPVPVESFGAGSHSGSSGSESKESEISIDDGEGEESEAEREVREAEEHRRNDTHRSSSFAVWFFCPC